MTVVVTILLRASSVFERFGMVESLSESLSNLGDELRMRAIVAPPAVIGEGLLRFIEWEMCPFYTKATIAALCGLELGPVKAWLRGCAEWMANLYAHPVETKPKTHDPGEFAVWTVRRLILLRGTSDWQVGTTARLVESVVEQHPRALVSLGSRFPYAPAELHAAYEASVWMGQRWRAGAKALAGVQLREPLGVHLFDRAYWACDAGPICRIPGWVVVDSPTRLQLIDERLVVREHAE